MEYIYIYGIYIYIWNIEYGIWNIYGIWNMEYHCNIISVQKYIPYISLLIPQIPPNFLDPNPFWGILIYILSLNHSASIIQWM